MLLYTANDMLNKMQDEFALQAPVDRSGFSQSGHPLSSRVRRLRRAVSSLVSTVSFL